MEDIISREIIIHATPGKIWQVLTQPAYMQQWMADVPVVITSDWQKGSEIIFTGNLHGIDFTNKGIILQLQPEQIFQYTFWSTLSEHADIAENYSVITFQLERLEGETRLSFSQEKFATDVIYKHFNFYWNTALYQIKKVSEY